ncbi:MAG: hypothetical protein HY423_00655 [Candidatus Lambdaproteobacteria bacterium]|nr:hypothetical protein [Candidatus Lambdaproteobacteria bacterium]
MPIRLGPQGVGVRGEEAIRVTDPAAAAALGAALALRERLPPPAPRLLALLVGPAGDEETLREALAAGADEAIRVWNPAWEAGPPAAPTTARARAHAVAAAAALAEWAPALVLTGARSADFGTESFGAALAIALGAAFAHRAEEIAPVPRGWRVRVKLERGYGQALELALPAVVTWAGPPAPKPVPSLAAWLASRTASIRLATAPGQMPLAGEVRLRDPVPRVRRLPAADPALPPEARIDALLAAPPASGGAIVPAEHGVEAQVDALLRLLRARGLP